jgi:hypothetical protein
MTNATRHGAIGDARAETIRKTLLEEAREKLRAHLAAEAAVLAPEDGARGVVADVQELVNRLGATS